jgi:hypothetical protein
MAEERHEPYPLEPEKDREPGEARSPDPARKGKLEGPGFLSEFPEEADFDRDPELERAVAGPVRPAPRAEAREESVGEVFVRGGVAEARIWAIAGAVLLAGAMIATLVNADDRHVPRILLTLYNTLLHTGTGVVALFAAALFTERRLGSFELAAARMFTAVAAFSLIFSLHTNFIGEGWEHWKGEELVLATTAYILLVAAAFRLWNWQVLLYVVGSHFFLWLIVHVGMLLAAYVRSPVAAV